MRVFLIIISAIAFGFIPPKHKHKPVKKKEFYDPVMLVDSSKIKYNVITFVWRNDSCSICHLWYKTKVNVDTFSTRRKAKYSNLKYLKPKR